jgi:integrase
VFANPAGGSYDEDVLRRKLKKAGEQVGISWTVSWHCFRRYFATESDRKGMSQDDRQASLGHASSEMTAHYTTNDIERRRPITNLIAADLVQSIDARPKVAEMPSKPVRDSKSLREKLKRIVKTA